jgi:murein DD-endopeptidase MepM/ murein hydrolase activator NlpD
VERRVDTPESAGFPLKKLVLIGLCLLLFWGNHDLAQAEKMFKYRDENGVWHFTNIAPVTKQSVEVRQVRVKTIPERLKVQKRGTKSRPILWAINRYYGPIELEVTLERQVNISSDPPLPLRSVIPACSESRVVTLWPTKSEQPWGYRSWYRYVFGDPKAKHLPSRPYCLPFQSGKACIISQGFHGKFSHHYPSSRYAVDFAMPEGTLICAARDGVVMDVANDFFTGGLEAEYAERANLIRILHDDGTMAVYAHLKLESARFPLGKRVNAGDVIAESGNTGFSTGPHLHFVIQMNEEMRLVAVPFVFKGSDGKGVIPEEKMVLTASR